MDYKILTQDERDDTTVAFLHAQERDHYCHAINKARFEAMLPTLANGQFKDRIVKLLADTNDRLAEVEMIIAHTTSTLPPQQRIDAAQARIAAKS